MPLFGESNYSVIGEHAVTFDKYVQEGRTFTGRDDGKLRAELDDSNTRYIPEKLRSKVDMKEIIATRTEEELIGVIEDIAKSNIYGYKESAKLAQKAIDTSLFSVYLDEGKLKSFLMSEDSQNRDKIEKFVREQKPYKIKDTVKDVWRLSDVFEATELFEAYPQLKDVLVYETNLKNAEGGTDGYKIYIQKERSEANIRETLLHEIQHIIQNIEKFAQGSSPKDAYQQLRRAAEKAQRKLDNRNSLSERDVALAEEVLTVFAQLERDYKGNKTRAERLINKLTFGIWPRVLSDYDIYSRAAGEVEAENVAQRADYTAEERSEIPFNLTLDYVGEAWVDFSIISDHLTSWERNPEAELGELGRFGDNLQGKLQPIGEKFYDQRVANMITALKRRQRELQHIKEGSTDDAQKIFGEMQAIVNQLTNMLPKGYRFGLEPYLEFLTVYADLYGTGESGRAGAALPMAGWQEIMGRSFEKRMSLYDGARAAATPSSSLYLLSSPRAVLAFARFPRTTNLSPWRAFIFCFAGHCAAKPTLSQS